MFTQVQNGEVQFQSKGPPKSRPRSGLSPLHRKKSGTAGSSGASFGKARVLTVHGKGDNTEVAALQMSNLNLVGCNLVGAEGPLESPADPTVERYVDGPFYSWYDLASNNGFCSEQILQGLCHLHSFIEDNGPFDGAFGFSQGACMLTLLMQDDVVRLLNSRFGLHFTVGTHIEHASRGKGVVVDVRDDDSRGKPYSVRFDSGETHHYTIDQINAKNTRLQQTASALIKRMFTVGSRIVHPLRGPGVVVEVDSDDPRGRPYRIKFDNGQFHQYSSFQLSSKNTLKRAAGTVVKAVKQNPTNVHFESPSLGFVVLACASDICAVRKKLGLPAEPSSKIAWPLSVHIIGKTDPYRPASEAVAMHMFEGRSRLVLYKGGGHTIGRDIQANELFATRMFAHLTGTPAADGLLLLQQQSFDGGVAYAESMGHHVRPVDEEALDWHDTSEFTEACVVPNVQVVRCAVKAEAVASHPLTFRGLLEAQPSEKPFLRDAQRPGLVTTYGQLLDFISAGGPGDLRRIGVQPGQCMVYSISGGSALGAGAFITVASQTCGAPLDPNVTAEDAAAAIEQFQAVHVLLFDGVASDGLEAAAKSADGVTIHRATPLGMDQPGLFTLRSEMPADPGPPLEMKPEDPVLLLRTSGTTSKPKGVPLRQGQLVRNGLLLSGTIKLEPNDVCINAMPLFHIGGISASILSTMAVGAQVTCMAAFKPDLFIEALAGRGYAADIADADISASTGPRPSWYSSVPTIHMAVVNYLRSDQNGAGQTTLQGQGNTYGVEYGLHRLLQVDHLSKLPAKMTSVMTKQAASGVHQTVLAMAGVADAVKHMKMPRRASSTEQQNATAFDMNADKKHDTCLTTNTTNIAQSVTHALRFIRSGAATLTPDDMIALSKTYGGVPIYSTYSMSEQMRYRSHRRGLSRVCTCLRRQGPSACQSARLWRLQTQTLWCRSLQGSLV